MAKPKSPLLSLGARGTIADALTYQKRGQGTIAREKPIPAYRRTLPQVYQRWLYEDYAYLWTQQSEATRRQYAADGSRFHLTGFQSWMKYQLTNLPDIAGLWKLDEIGGATAYDSSRNANNGTIFGASPATGIIGPCLTFDGINDRIVAPYHTSLDFTDAFTLEAFIYPTEIPFTDARIILSKGTGAQRDYWLYGQNATDQFRISIRAPGLITATTVATGIQANQWTHIAVTYDRVALKIFVDATEMASLPETDPMVMTPKDLRIGEIPGALRWKGRLDHIILYNRALDLSEIQRHSERRYP